MFFTKQKPEVELLINIIHRLRAVVVVLHEKNLRKPSYDFLHLKNPGKLINTLIQKIDQWNEMVDKKNNIDKIFEDIMSFLNGNLIPIGNDRFSETYMLHTVMKILICECVRSHDTKYKKEFELVINNDKNYKDNAYLSSHITLFEMIKNRISREELEKFCLDNVLSPHNELINFYTSIFNKIENIKDLRDTYNKIKQHYNQPTGAKEIDEESSLLNDNGDKKCCIIL